MLNTKDNHITVPAGATVTQAFLRVFVNRAGPYQAPTNPPQLTGNTNLYEQTGTVVNNVYTLIATGTNSSGTFAATASSGLFTSTNGNAPTTPTGTPFTVVFACGACTPAVGAGSTYNLYEANSAGIYQLVGTAVSGN